MISAPDESNSLWAQTLDFEQIEHGGPVLLQQFRVQRELSFLKQLLHVLQHALADPGDGQNLFRLTDQVCNLLWLGFNGFGSIAIRADAEGILTINLKQVGGFVENAGDCLVVHLR